VDRAGRVGLGRGEGVEGPVVVDTSDMVLIRDYQADGEEGMSNTMQVGDSYLHALLGHGFIRELWLHPSIINQS
jgi:hypothetical protein